MGVVALVVEVVTLGADRLGKRHEFAHALVLVVLFGAAHAEVAEVRQRSALGQAHLANHGRQPGPVRRQTAVVLDDNADLVLGGEFTEPPKSVGGQADLFVIRTARPRVDANGMAAEKPRRLDPTIVVLDGLRAFLRFWVAEPTFAVDHDQQALDAQIRGPLLHLAEIAAIFGLVLEELVDILDRLDPEVLLRGLGEVQIVELARTQRAVQRPLGERNLEDRFVPGRRQGGSTGERRGPEPDRPRSRLAQELTSIDRCTHQTCPQQRSENSVSPNSVIPSPPPSRGPSPKLA